MKQLIFLLLFFSTVVFALTPNTGYFDKLTSNNPATNTVAILKDVDIQSTGGLYVPSGTTGQRPTPTKDGMLRYNSTTLQAEIFKNGVWSSVGGGGISNWLTGTTYNINDVVINSSKIYQCLINHTSGTFSSDLASNYWTIISAVNVTAATGTLAIVNGGTGSTTQNFVDLTATQTVAGIKTFSSSIVGSVTGNSGATTNILGGSGGSIPYQTATNNTSLLSNGSAGQVLTSAGTTLAPTWTSPSAGNLTGPIQSTGTATYILDGAIPTTKLAVTNSNLVYGDSTGFAGTDTSLTFSDTTKLLSANLKGGINKILTASGTDSITLTPSPALSNYSNNVGYEFVFIAAGTNTTNSVTLNLNGLGSLNAYIDGTGTSTPAGRLVGGLYYRGIITSTSTVQISSFNSIGTNGGYVTGALNLKQGLGLDSGGNGSVLINGGFELSNTSGLGLGWTNSAAGTYSIATASSSVIEGSQSQQVSLSSQIMNLNQTVNTTSGQSTQWAVGSFYKTTAASFQICSIVDSLEQTCVPSANLILDGNSHSIEIPTTKGNTNIGIEYKTATESTTVIVDGAYVKQGIGLQSLSNDYGPTAYTPTSPNSSLAPTGANCTHSRSGPFLNIQCYFATLPAGGSGASQAQISLPTGLTTLSTYPTYQMVGTAGIAVNTATSYYVLVQGGVGYVTFSAQAGGASALTPQTGTALSTSSAFTFNARILIQGWSPIGSSVYSQASANTNSTDYTSTFTGFASVAPTTNQCKWSREGQWMNIDCSYTPTTTSGSTLFSFSLPSGYTLDTSKITTLNTTANAGQVWGTYGAAVSGSGFIVSAPGTSTSLLYGGDEFQTTSPSVLVPQVSNRMSASGVINNIHARIPIAGWSNSAQIVGSFTNYNSTNGITSPKIFSTTLVTTSGVLSNNMGGIFSSCTAANPSVCTLVGLTSTPNCSATVYGNGLASVGTSSATSSGISIGSYTATTGIALASQTINIFCQGY